MLRRIIILAPTIALVCAVQTETLRATAVTISQPAQFGYDTSTTLIDISDFSDLETVPSISGGGLTVTFSPDMVRLSIPEEWGSWGSPPATELDTAACPGLGINCPPVLWSGVGMSSVTMELSSPVSVFGFEAEPDNPAAENMIATFFLDNGTTYSVDLNPSGYYGALLFAVSSTVPIQDVTLTNLAGDDFAIANVRFSDSPLATPEPSGLLVVATGLAGLAVAAHRRRLRQR